MQITISGFPGAGKGILRKLLEKELKIKSFSVGDLRRQFALEQGISIQDLNALGEKDPQWDIKADEYQRQWAQEQKEFILEGRLSYYFLPNSKKIFLYVKKDVGAQRILGAQRESEIKTTTIEDQIRINQERCESDIRRYKEIYKIENCYDKRNFDILVNTSHLTPEEVKNKILEKL